VDEKSGRKHLIMQVFSETEDTSRHYRQEIPLKAPVDEGSAEAEYNNGVLTVKFPILEDDNSGTSISIK
jgi:HSP20 family molecular chaperone IbpA